jgi:hypothetical protein
MLDRLEFNTNNRLQGEEIFRIRHALSKAGQVQQNRLLHTMLFPPAIAADQAFLWLSTKDAYFRSMDITLSSQRTAFAFSHHFAFQFKILYY